MIKLLKTEKKSNFTRILIIGDAQSPLTRERGLVGYNKGYEIHWYTKTAVKIPGISVYSRHLSTLHKLSLVVQMFYIWYLIKKIKPSLIHVFWANHNLSNLVLSKFKPLVVTIMGGEILSDQRYCARTDKFFTKMLLDKAQCITSKSEFLDRALLGIGDYKEKIRRVTWGIDLDKFGNSLQVTGLRRELKIPDNAVVFFSVRLCEHFYNHHIVIDAFAKLLESGNSNYVLLVSKMYGNQNYINYLKSLAMRLNVLSQIRFIETIPSCKMPLYYNLSKVTISIPNSDGMPQSLYEAMACGSFHILGDLFQYKELIENKKNGLFVSIGDSEELACAMQWIVDNPEIVKDAAKINREKIQKLANKKEQDEIVNDIYCKLIGKN